MAKKDLGGLEALIGGKVEKMAKAAPVDNGNGNGKRGRPRKYDEPNSLPADEERASIIVKKGTWDKFKALAYWDRLKQKTLLDTILTDYLGRREKKSGTIKPIPADADR
jgi:hypothetical protein